MMGRPPIDSQVIQRAIALIQSGATKSKAASIVGVHRNSLGKYLKPEALNQPVKQPEKKNIYLNNGRQKKSYYRDTDGISHSCEASSLLTAAMYHIERLELFINEQVGAKFIPPRPPRLM